jgi:uncharacterized protein YjbI with pentapeptide repeats
MSMASAFHHEMHNLSLVGTYLRNSSFNRLDLSNSNFSNSRLESRGGSFILILVNLKLNEVILLNSQY